jgi:hypothetical protein
MLVIVVGGDPDKRLEFCDYHIDKIDDLDIMLPCEAIHTPDRSVWNDDLIDKATHAEEDGILFVIDTDSERHIPIKVRNAARAVVLMSAECAKQFFYRNVAPDGFLLNASTFETIIYDRKLKTLKNCF